MKTVGIIAEYNPFHNGHKYHVNQARKLSNADIVIAVMSGDFTQRGEPTIIDKWKRAESALKNGVDLVVELPYQFAVQPADIFAEGGVRILNQLKCETLACGVETDDFTELSNLVDFYVKHVSEVEQALQKTPDNMVFAERFALALEKVGGEEVDTEAWSKPNNQLAIQYMLANKSLKEPMDIQFVKRYKSDHNDAEALNETIASGTAIRLMASEKVESVKSFVPSETFDELSNGPVVTNENYWPLLRYQLAASDTHSLSDIYQMTEGIEHRLLKQFNFQTSYADYLESIKTKRYTYARLQRLLNYVLLQVNKNDMITGGDIPMRLLGFTESGQMYLNKLKHNYNTELVSRLSKDSNEKFQMDIRAGKIYRITNSKHILEQDFRKSPIIIKNEDVK